jgi:hypothetical protein
MSKINVCRRHGALVALDRLYIRRPKIGTYCRAFISMSEIKIVRHSCEFCDNPDTIEAPPKLGEGKLLNLALMVFCKGYSLSGPDSDTVEDNMRDAVELARDIEDFFVEKESNLEPLGPTMSKASPYVRDLTRRLMTCEEWMWLPGMKAVSDTFLDSGYRLTDDGHPSYPEEYDWPHDLGLRYPDLEDDLTLTCVQKLVEEKHSSIYGGPVEAIFLSPGIDRDGSVFWEISLMYYRGLITEFKEGKSKAEALVIALESDIITY